jgi:signal transduction histidine kinase
VRRASPARLAPRRWLRLPRRTARLRLTLLYSGMFLALGTVVIAVTYVLASQTETVSAAAVPLSKAVGGATPEVVRLKAGVVLQHSADLDRLLTASWLVLAITAVASAVLGWFAAGRVLRPLRQMTATARTISAGSLDQRLALTGPDDEFRQLGDTLDALLGRLESAFEAQRRFVANASHELRTPLTVERAILQVALADPDAGAATLRAACEELLACGREQEALLEALLTLATSERGLRHREPLDLATLAGEVLLAPRSELAHGALALHRALVPAPTSGDAALVERLIANLIDNAVRYNCAGGSVEVRTATGAGRSELSVSNTGPLVGADQIDRLLEPFQRLADDRTAAADGHHGLGLSIVRAIAIAHDATISVIPGSAGGLGVTVSFPYSP